MLRSIVAAIVLFFVSIFGGHQGQVPANVQSQPAAAVLAFPQGADPFSASTSTAAGTTSPSDAAAQTVSYITQPVIERVVDSGSLASANFVTQDELNAQLLQLSNALTQQFTQPPTASIPQYVAAGGNAANPYAAANAINNLSNVTITGATITNSSVNGGNGGGSGTVDSGTQGQFAFYDTAGTTLTATSSLFLAQSGNVGIGTTNPQAALQVVGLVAAGSDATANADAVVIQHNGTEGLINTDYVGGGSYTPLELDSGANSGQLVLNTNGDVGIGTTSPISQLAIDSSDPNGTFLTLSNQTNGNFDAIHFISRNSNNAPNDWLVGTNIDDNNIFEIAPGDTNTGADTFVVDNNGNVGIGTSTPTTTLAVAGTGQFTGQVAIGNDAQISLTDSNPAATVLFQSGLRIHNDLSGDLSVDTSNILYDGIDDFSTYTHTGSGGLVGQGINGQPTITASSTGQVYFLSGLTGQPTNFGSGYYSLYGVAGDAINNGSGEGTLTGLNSYNISSSGGLVDQASGVYVSQPTFTGGAVTNNYGLYIADQSSAGSVQPANNYQFFSDANGGATPFVQLESGNVGIGTTTPHSRLEVWGPDSAASTTAFIVANSASTTEFTVRDNGNATLAGSLIQNSDQRLKTNIQSLDASDTLFFIDELNPVTFNWADPNQGSGPQIGFIAQQVLPIFPSLVSTTSPTARTPNGTLSLNYIGLIAPIISAIQALDQQLTDLANAVAGFAQSFTTKQLTFNRATGDDLSVTTLEATTTTTQELCVGDICVTPAQFQAMVAAANISQSSGQGSDATSSSAASTTPHTPPIIQINGDNPAIIQAGGTYNDLGATITGPQADLNLGIKTYLNGTPASNFVIDTSELATDTIDYVATDQNGLTSTSTRTVIIEASPSITPANDASTTDSTSTAL